MSEWREATLGDVASFVNGYPFKPRELSGRGLPVIRIKQLLDPLADTDFSDTEVPDRVRIDDGDLIFSWSGSLASRVWSRGPAVLNQHLFRVTEREGVDRGWLHLALDHAVDELSQKTHGTTMKHVTKAVLKAHRVRLPPLAEQRRIVDLIGVLDAHIDALAEEGGRVRALQAAAREDLLTTQGGWTSADLGSVLEIARGGSPRPIDSYFTTAADGVDWIKIGDVPPDGKYIGSTAQKIKPEGVSRSRRVSPGDFVLSNSMSFGRPYIMRISGCIHDGWLVLADPGSTFDQDFLYNLLLSRDVQEQFEALAAGSGVRNLNIGVVGSVTVQIPPMAEQLRISAALNAFDEHVSAVGLELERSRRTRSALLDQLLTQELRLPPSYDALVESA